MEERKGFFTKEQEEKLDAFIELEGIYEKLDGPAIRLIDNVIFEKMKVKLEQKNPELVKTVIMVIDEVFANL
jgi:hypothetical protein